MLPKAITIILTAAAFATTAAANPLRDEGFDVDFLSLVQPVAVINASMLMAAPGLAVTPVVLGQTAYAASSLAYWAGVSLWPLRWEHCAECSSS